MTQAPTLYPEIREVEGPPGKGLHGYYRKANGWIVVASTTSGNREGYEYKGGTFLPMYGQFANGTFQGAARERDARGVPWNPADEPWRLIFQKGGAKEFPVDQIIAYHWHVRPPYKEAKFPQLQGVEIEDLPCPECDKGIFSSPNLQEAAVMLKAHLTSGINDRHKYTPTDLRELGQEWGLNFETARTRKAAKRLPDKSLEGEEAPEMTVGEMQVNEEFKCHCGWAPPATSKRPTQSLKFHQRTHDR